MAKQKENANVGLLDKDLKKLEWMQNVNKKFKSDVVKFGAITENQEKIKFSSPRLNYMTRGGLLLGRVLEIFGMESSGKSTLMLDLIKNAQEQYPDRDVLYVDTECTYDPHWANTLGVDTDKIIIFTPDGHSAEDILQMMLDAIINLEPCLMILDSYPGLVGEEELNKEMGDKSMAIMARLIRTFLRKATSSLIKHKCLLVIVNQLVDNFNAGYGAQMKITPGGNSIKFFATTRMECRKGQFIDSNGNEIGSSGSNVEDPCGHKIHVKLVKNKGSKNDRRLGVATLNYETGIDYLQDYIDIGLQEDIIQKGGAWINFNGEKFNGMTKFRQALKDNKELMNVLRTKVDDILDGKTDKDFDDVDIDDFEIEE